MVEKRCCRSKPWGILSVSLILVMAWISATALAAPLPGGTLNPLTIPKYVQPLIIPPEMPSATVQPAVRAWTRTTFLLPNTTLRFANSSSRFCPVESGTRLTGAVTRFRQPRSGATVRNRTYLLLGMWPPAALGSPGANYNYPAFTVENLSNSPTTVRWINDLKDPVTGNYLPHILTNTVDQTLHWANPTGTGCVDSGLPQQTDCATLNPAPLHRTGPDCHSTFMERTSTPNLMATRKLGGCRQPITSRRVHYHRNPLYAVRQHYR